MGFEKKKNYAWDLFCRSHKCMYQLNTIINCNCEEQGPVKKNYM